MSGGLTSESKFWDFGKGFASFLESISAWRSALASALHLTVAGYPR